jgi:radical SAM protein with 4Fe4S-binding SPASM domain
LPDWIRILDLLRQVGVPHIILTGGEATLHPDLLAIVRACAERQLIVGLNSNGRRLARGPLAHQLQQAGLAHVQVTLESHRAVVHDAMVGARAFDDTVAGIRAALAAGIPTITNTTLTWRNRAELEATLDFLYQLGIRTFAMNGMIYSGGGAANPDAIPEEQLAPLLLRARDHARRLGMRFLWYTPTEYCRMNPVELEIGAKRCNAAEYSLCVEPDGSVLPCQSYYTSAGNLLRDGWEPIWNSALFRSFRERELDPKGAGLPEKCWECPDLPLCGGGCRIEREAREHGAAGCSTCEGGGCHSKAGKAGGRSSWNTAHSTTLIPIAAVPFRERRSSGYAAVPSVRA